MTEEDFRKDPKRVDGLRKALANSFLQEALLILHDAKAILDVDEKAEPIVSVRRHSKLSGRSEIIGELYLLATPFSEQDTTPRRPDFGVKEKPPEGWDESLL